MKRHGCGGDERLINRCPHATKGEGKGNFVNEPIQFHQESVAIVPNMHSTNHPIHPSWTPGPIATMYEASNRGEAHLATTGPPHAPNSHASSSMYIDNINLFSDSESRPIYMVTDQTEPSTTNQ